MQKSRWTINRRTALATIILAPTAFIAWKANEYTADPTGEKACSPLFPEFAGDIENADQVEIAQGAMELPWSQIGGTINDASCLNQTAIHGVIRVTQTDDIQNALVYAAENNRKVSLAGVKHSMGGHAFYKDAVVLDMTHFNQMSLDAENKLLTVESGATWHDIQNFLHPQFAVKAMQSTDIFTVGGSISVNAHGMDHQVGAVGGTIRSIRFMLPDGSIQSLSRTENQMLFSLVIGGYGLFGIILDVTLEIVENAIYESGRQIIAYQDFPQFFEETLAENKKLGLMYSHLSTAPQSLLKELILYTYEEVAIENPEIPPLGEVSSTKLRRFVLNFSKEGPIPMRFKWFAEKHIEPRMESCSIVSRNQAMIEGEACMVSRNEPMHDSVKYLQNDLHNDTDILHEYFIPRTQFVPFIDGLRDIIVESGVTLLNASVRVVHPEENFLNYAPIEMFSIVLYINQSTDAAGHAQMRHVTEQLIDLAIDQQGTFFLPYQLYYTPAQLEQAYPNISAFFAAKKVYDPNLLLTNTFYEKYAGHFESA